MWVLKFVRIPFQKNSIKIYKYAILKYAYFLKEPELKWNGEWFHCKVLNILLRHLYGL